MKIDYGEPFVGRAGQLMNMAFEAVGIKREEVYIANIVKCRPPANRNPEDDEAAANKWSSNTLISSADFEVFKSNRDYSERRVLQFAKALGIAPGIVVGRMQSEGMIKYSMLNNLKEKYEITV